MEYKIWILKAFRVGVEFSSYRGHLARASVGSYQLGLECGGISTDPKGAILWASIATRLLRLLLQKILLL
jgi:hypothetical protein